MKIELSLAFGFKLFTLLFAAGLIGAALVPTHPRRRADEGPPPGSANVAPPSASAVVTAGTGPMTRALLDGIYFDVVRANGQGATADRTAGLQHWPGP